MVSERSWPAALHVPDALSTSEGWASAPLSEVSGTVTARIHARVSARNANAVAGFSDHGAAAFSALPVAVRFSAEGVIEVRDGDAYAADRSYPYEPGRWYEFEFAIDLAASRYDLSVAPCGEAPMPLRVGASFRADAPAVSSLSHAVLWSSGAGTIDLGDIDLTGEPPATGANPMLERAADYAFAPVGGVPRLSQVKLWDYDDGVEAFPITEVGDVVVAYKSSPGPAVRPINFRRAPPIRGSFYWIGIDVRREETGGTFHYMVMDPSARGPDGTSPPTYWVSNCNIDIRSGARYGDFARGGTRAPVGRVLPRWMVQHVDVQMPIYGDVLDGDPDDNADHSDFLQGNEGGVDITAADCDLGGGPQWFFQGNIERRPNGAADSRGWTFRNIRQFTFPSDDVPGRQARSLIMSWFADVDLGSGNYIPVRLENVWCHEHTASTDALRRLALTNFAAAVANPALTGNRFNFRSGGGSSQPGFSGTAYFGETESMPVPGMRGEHFQFRPSTHGGEREARQAFIDALRAVIASGDDPEWGN